MTEEEQHQREAAASATGAVKTSEVKSKLKYEVQGGNYLGFGQGGKLNVGWGRKGATWTAPKEQQDVVTMAVDEGVKYGANLWLLQYPDALVIKSWGLGK